MEVETMNASIDKKTKALTVLVACLIALALAQMYFLYVGGTPFAKNVAKAASDDSNAQTFQLAPNPKMQNLNTPIGGGSWDPFKEMDSMHKEMEKMFSQAFGRYSMSPQFNGLTQGFSFNPDADVSENDQEYVVKMDVPGVDKSKINVKLEGQRLSISGVREQESQQNAFNNEISRERSLGSFERSLTLPGPAKNDGMRVDYQNGVLTINIPKDNSPQKLHPLPMQQ
jgi:HSP20 family protein